MNHRIALSLATRGASLCVAAWIAGTATDALAATVYKLTDNDGRITYSGNVPKGFSGTVVTLDFEATAAAVEAAQPAQAVPAANAATENEKIIRHPSGAGDYTEIRLAEARLDEALKALERARDNSTPEDWIHFDVRKPITPPITPPMPPPITTPGTGSHDPRGNARGNTRGRGITPEYAERLDRLDQDVKDAQTNLAEAEGRYRRSF